MMLLGILKSRYVVFLGLIYGLLAFPMFYFVYKFGDPEPLAHDFFQYYRLYKSWALEEVHAPFNMRLVGSFVVNLLYKTGLAYDTVTVFDKYLAWGFEKEVYFCAVFFNYLCVVFTCVLLFFILRHLVNNSLLAFTGALLYLLGFGTLFYELMPLTDACSVLLFTASFYWYLKKSYWVLLPLGLLLFQREYVFLALGLISMLDYFNARKKYYFFVFLACVLLMFAFVILRKTIFYTTALDFQLSPAFVWKSVSSRSFPVLVYLKQLVMTLNIFFVYLGLVAYKFFKKMPVNRYELMKTILLFLQVNLLSFGWSLGTNAGRYFFIIVPFVICELVKELHPMLVQNGTLAPPIDKPDLSAVTPP